MHMLPKPCTSGQISMSRLPHATHLRGMRCGPWVLHKPVREAESAEGAAATPATMRAFEAGVDTIVWQTLASVLIPGFTINRVVATPPPGEVAASPLRRETLLLRADGQRPPA